MNLTTASCLILAAVAASIVLLFQHRERVFPATALIASGLEALIAFRVVVLKVSSLPIGLILAAALLVAGLIVWVRGSGKAVTTAATVAASVGVLQVLLALKLMA